MGPWPSHRGGQPPPGQGERGPRGVKASRPPLCTVTGGEGATRWRPAASRPSPQPPRRAAVAAAGNGPGGHRGFLWVFFPLFFFFGFFFPPQPLPETVWGAMQQSLGEGGGGLRSAAVPTYPHRPAAEGSWSPSPARQPPRRGCGKTEAQRGF